MLVKSDPSKKKGVIGITRAILEYSKNGYTVLMPLVDANKYDFVAEKDGKFIRVQVKTTCRKTVYGDKGYIVLVEGRGSSRNSYNTTPFNKNDYDRLFILTEKGDCWDIPTDAITGKLEVTVGTAKYADYKV